MIKNYSDLVRFSQMRFGLPGISAGGPPAQGWVGRGEFMRPDLGFLVSCLFMFLPFVGPGRLAQGSIIGGSVR